MRFCLSFLLVFIPLLPMKAQNRLISLKNERLTVSSKEFFIIEVQDQRSNSSNIGRLYFGNTTHPTSLDKGTAKSLDYFLQKNFNAHRPDSLTPIIMVIKAFSINEKLTNGMVTGDLKLSISFEVFGDGQQQVLTAADAGINYSRHANDLPTVELMIRKCIENHLKGFKNWFKTYSPKNESLARQIKLIVIDEQDQADDDTIHYDSKRKLTWNDFNGPVKFGSRWAAQVFTSFGFDMHTTIRNRTIEVRVKIRVFSDKTMSWARPDSKNDYVLAHEQLHFDVAKWVAEQFKLKIRTMDLSLVDYSSEIQYQYLEYYRLMSRTQQQYDDETKHGLDKIEQERWRLKVKEGLERLGI